MYLCSRYIFVNRYTQHIKPLALVLYEQLFNLR